MRTIVIEGKINSSVVFLDETCNYVEISGNSTLFPSNWSYSNVLHWIFAMDNNTIYQRTINLKFTKVSTNSLRRLSAILDKPIFQFPDTT